MTDTVRAAEQPDWFDGVIRRAEATGDGFVRLPLSDWEGVVSCWRMGEAALAAERQARQDAERERDMEHAKYQDAWAASMCHRENAARYCPVPGASHVCLTTEDEWRPCPESLCEAGDLLGFASGLADELVDRRVCLVAARDDLAAIEGAAVEDGGIWLRAVAQRRRVLVEEAIASTDAALRAASALVAGEPPPPSEPEDADVAPAPADAGTSVGSGSLSGAAGAPKE